MRYSKQRELVMQTVERLCDHPTAEEIYDKAAQECPNLSLGTVYRNLNSLVEAGRVRGGVTDADVDGKQVMELVKNQKGRVQDCAVVLLGVCEECCRRQDAEVAAAKQA